MGYCIVLENSEFRIKTLDLAKAAQAIRGLHGSETIGDSSGRHFSWVDKGFHLLDGIDNLLKAWRWAPEFADDGSICGLEFEGEKSGDDEILFGALAPFVVADSFLMFLGEDGDRWRYLFDGKGMEIQYAKVVWE